MVENDASSKRLYRSRNERMLAGVAGGLGQYFNVDPVIVRLVFVALFLIPPVGGLALVAYLIMAIVVPSRPLDESEPVITGSRIDTGRGPELLGYLLIAVGVLFLAANLGLFTFIIWDNIWPLVLVAVGAFLLLRAFRK
jgi:phage shock protein C